MKKVILITNIPNPYRVPLFNELANRHQSLDLKLKIVFANSTYKRRLFKLNEADFKFEYSYLNNEAITVGNNTENAYFTYKGLTKLLSKENPDLIIVSGFSSATLKVFYYCLFHKARYIIWNGSIEKKGRKDSYIRLLQRKFLSKFASGFIAYGSRAKSYLMNLGAKEDNTFIATNTVDTSYFESQTNLLRANESTSALTRFIYLGYLVPRKNVGLLIDIAHQLKQKRSDFCIDIIGDGESKNSLERKVEELQLTDQIKFHGFKQKEELPAFFAKSSALLFQTDFDIWGLVLNEAMAAGLPCLASINAGASYDLIEEGVNGYLVNYENKEAMVQKLEFLIENPEKVAEMGKQASDFIRKKASLATAADGFMEAIGKTLH